MTRFKASDFPEGSPMHRQLSAAESQIKPPDALEQAKKPMNRPEQDLQRQIIQVADSMPMVALVQREDWPGEIWKKSVGEYLYHIPNGGKRNAVEAAIFAGIGVRAGVWDLFLMLPCFNHGRIWAGLYMELKDPSNGAGLSPAQGAFGIKARLLGYGTVVIQSVPEYHDATEHYLKGAIGWKLP